MNEPHRIVRIFNAYGTIRLVRFCARCAAEVACMANVEDAGAATGPGSCVACEEG